MRRKNQLKDRFNKEKSLFRAQSPDKQWKMFTNLRVAKIEWEGISRRGAKRKGGREKKRQLVHNVKTEAETKASQ